MGYEIDFLPVGKDKSGDAITLRCGNLFGQRAEQYVVVIDGGFTDTGDTLVEHLNTYYKTNKVDLVISTHPDEDHSAGLEAVLKKCEVSALWMHQPWNHTEDIAKLFKDGRVTDLSVKETLRKSLENARTIEGIAKAKQVPIVEPFSGVKDVSQRVFVLGPTWQYYESLLPDFRCTPEAKEPGIIAKAIGGIQEAVKKVAENLNIETLTDEGETSAENNSAAIVMVIVDNDALLFTSDAGIPALTQVADLLDRAGFDRARIRFIQVPHHGSARNVGPTILDRLIGPKLLVEANARTAFVSTAKPDDAKHPSKQVTNAFRRRGAPVHCTGGVGKCHCSNAPGWQARGWNPSTPLPLFNEVDE